MATGERDLSRTEKELLPAAWLSRIYYPRRFEHAWSPTELQVLRHLAQPGKTSDTGRAIARQLALDPGTVSTSLKLLRERRMLVVEKSVAYDGEMVSLPRITMAGESLLDRHLEHAHSRVTDWLAVRAEWEHGTRYR